MSTEATALSAPIRQRSEPRRPTRGRGVARYQALLEATEALLEENSPDQIGLYQIAEQAEVPPASVYHFFPTKEAAYQALAERDLEGLMRMHGQPIDARMIASWQDLLAFDLRRSMNYYNAHPPLMKILYGGFGGVEARNIDILVTERMANQAFDRMNLIFYMPFVREAPRRFQIRLAIIDGIWSICVREFGRITEDYFHHALQACIAYSRVFLPEELQLRPALVEAAARGETVTLPYLLEPADSGSDGSTTG